MAAELGVTDMIPPPPRRPDREESGFGLLAEPNSPRGGDGDASPKSPNSSVARHERPMIVGVPVSSLSRSGGPHVAVGSPDCSGAVRQILTTTARKVKGSSQNTAQPPAYYYFFPFLSGCILAIHGGISSRLSEAYGSPVFACLVNMFGATVMLLVAIGVGLNRAFAENKKKEEFRFWKMTGGAFGVVAVTLIPVCIPRIGFVAYFVISVAGQMLGSTICDQIGFGGMPVRRLDGWKVLALCVVLFGVMIVATARKGGDDSMTDDDIEQSAHIGFAILSFFVGHTLPYQGCVNAAMARCCDFPTYAALTSFVGSSLIIIVVFFSFVFPLNTAPERPLALPFWMSGILGGTHVFIVLFFTPLIGVASLWLLVLCGQLFASIPLDHFGMLGFKERSVSAKRAFGVVIAALGVVINAYRIGKTAKHQITEGGQNKKTNGAIDSFNKGSSRTSWTDVVTRSTRSLFFRFDGIGSHSLSTSGSSLSVDKRQDKRTWMSLFGGTPLTVASPDSTLNKEERDGAASDSQHHRSPLPINKNILNKSSPVYSKTRSALDDVADIGQISCARMIEACPANSKINKIVHTLEDCHVINAKNPTRDLQSIIIQLPQPNTKNNIKTTTTRTSTENQGNDSVSCSVISVASGTRAILNPPVADRGRSTSTQGRVHSRPRVLSTSPGKGSTVIDSHVEVKNRLSSNLHKDH